MHIVGRRTMLALPVERLVGNSHNSHSGHHHHMSRATTMSPDSSASDSSSEHTLSPCSYSTKLQMMMTNNNNVSSSTNSTCTQTNSITSNCSHVISSTTPAFEGETRDREVELRRGHEHRDSFFSPTNTPSTSPSPPALMQQAKVKSNSHCGIVSSADDESIQISVKQEEDENENRKEEYECKQDGFRRSSCCDKNCEEDNKAAVAQAVTLTEGINNPQHGQSKQKDHSQSQRGIKTPTCMNESSDHHNTIDEHEDDHANGFLLAHHHHHYNGSDSGDEKGGPPSRPPSSTSTTSSSCFNISSLITNRPQIHSLRFSIDDILRPDFGKSAIQQQTVPTGNNNAKIGNNGIVSKERGRTIARSASVKSSNSSTSNERPSRPSSVRNHSEDSNSSCKSNSSSRNTEVVDETKVNPKVPQGPLLWPAWVYCTRYSDRPSSGPRSRRIRKAGDPPAIKTVSEQPEEKRPRTAFTAEQLARLKQEFDENRYLTEKRRQDLARDLKLHENQIKIWFQNKRAKLKKSTGQRGGLALQLMAQGLYNHSTVPIDEDEDYLLLPP